MYPFDFSPGTLRSPYEESSGPRLGHPGIGSPQVHKIPWQIGKSEKSGLSVDQFPR